MGSAESGFVVFKFHEGQLAQANVRLEVVMDDYMFPAYVSPKVHSKTAKFEDSKWTSGDGSILDEDVADC